MSQSNDSPEKRGRKKPDEERSKTSKKESSQKKKTPKKRKKKKKYVPKNRCGAYAMMLVLYDNYILDNLKMTKEDICNECPPYTNTAMLPDNHNDLYSGWSSMNGTLAKKGFVDVEKRKRWLFSLTPKGIRLGQRLKRTVVNIERNRNGQDPLPRIDTSSTSYEEPEEEEEKPNRNINEMPDEEDENIEEDIYGLNDSDEENEENYLSKNMYYTSEAPKSPTPHQLIPPSPPKPPQQISMKKKKSVIDLTEDSDSDISDIEDEDENITGKKRTSRPLVEDEINNNSSNNNNENSGNIPIAQTSKKRKTEVLKTLPIKLHSCSFLTEDGKTTDNMNQACLDQSVEGLGPRVLVCTVLSIDTSSIGGGVLEIDERQIKIPFEVIKKEEIRDRPGLTRFSGFVFGFEVSNGFHDYFSSYFQNQSVDVRINSVENIYNNNNNNNNNNKIEEEEENEGEDDSESESDILDDEDSLPLSPVVRTNNPVSVDSEDEDEEDEDIIPTRTTNEQRNNFEQRRLTFENFDDFLVNENRNRTPITLNDENLRKPRNQRYDIILILDKRERRSATRKDTKYIVSEIRKGGVIVEERSLGLGDMIWIAKERSTGEEYVLNSIVERKSADDLSKSLEDNRYSEQKFRLIQSGMNVYYLIEGKFQNNKHEPYILDQAVVNIINLFVNLKIKMVRTRNVDASIQWLVNMTKYFERKYYKMNEDEERISSELFYEDRITKKMMTVDDFNKSWMKDKNLRMREIFGRQLIILDYSTAEKALGILEKYPTPAHLMDQYYNDNNNNNNNIRNKESLLSDLPVVSLSREEKNDKVGFNVSRLLHDTFNGGGDADDEGDVNL